eukprot:2641500-Prymnesium_polylepis.1
MVMLRAYSFTNTQQVRRTHEGGWRRPRPPRPDAVFSWHGCTLEIGGPCVHSYVSRAPRRSPRTTQQPMQYSLWHTLCRGAVRAHISARSHSQRKPHRGAGGQGDADGELPRAAHGARAAARCSQGERGRRAARPRGWPGRHGQVVAVPPPRQLPRALGQCGRARRPRFWAGRDGGAGVHLGRARAPPARHRGALARGWPPAAARLALFRRSLSAALLSLTPRRRRRPGRSEGPRSSRRSYFGLATPPRPSASVICAASLARSPPPSVGVSSRMQTRAPAASLSTHAAGWTGRATTCSSAARPPVPLVCVQLTSSGASPVATAGGQPLGGGPPHCALVPTWAGLDPRPHRTPATVPPGRFARPPSAQAADPRFPGGRARRHRRRPAALAARAARQGAAAAAERARRHQALQVGRRHHAQCHNPHRRPLQPRARVCARPRTRTMLNSSTPSWQRERCGHALTTTNHARGGHERRPRITYRRARWSHAGVQHWHGATGSDVGIAHWCQAAARSAGRKPSVDGAVSFVGAFCPGRRVDGQRQVRRLAASEYRRVRIRQCRRHGAPEDHPVVAVASRPPVHSAPGRQREVAGRRMTMSAQRRSAVQLTERAAGPFGAGTGQNTHGERETRRDGLPVRGAVLLASTGPAYSQFFQRILRAGNGRYCSPAICTLSSARDEAASCRWHAPYHRVSMRRRRFSPHSGRRVARVDPYTQKSQYSRTGRKGKTKKGLN